MSKIDHPANQGLQTTMLGIAINIALCIIKAVAGVVGNSYALVADAVESASDIFTSAVVWFGLKTASKPPDHDHPYGHGRAEPIATIVVALVLLAAAISIAVNSIHLIRTPHEVPKNFTLVVLAGVVAIKFWLSRLTKRRGAEIQSKAVHSDALHHQSDAITSAAAFIGIGVAIYKGPGYESADDWAALLASVLIAYNAYTIFRPALAELMDEAPPAEMVEAIRRTARSVRGVEDIEKCFVRKMGFEYFVDIHIIVDGSLPVRTGHDIGHRVKDAIIEAHPRVYDVLTHIEPDGEEELRQV
jgi:cation diffusion facilitator family transporter